jgi:hypothetical protein
MILNEMEKLAFPYKKDFKQLYELYTTLVPEYSIIRPSQTHLLMGIEKITLQGFTKEDLLAKLSVKKDSGVDMRLSLDTYINGEASLENNELILFGDTYENMNKKVEINSNDLLVNKVFENLLNTFNQKNI